MNLRAGPLQLAATSLILVSPFTKFALTLEPVARGVEEFVQQVQHLQGLLGIKLLKFQDLQTVQCPLLTVSIGLHKKDRKVHSTQ